MSVIFYPRKYTIKPPESSVINWGHPLANGLVWFALPGADHRRELVSRGLASLTTSGTFKESGMLGLAGGSTSTTNGGIVYPWSDKLSEITNQFTIIVWSKITALTNFSHLLTIPYSSTWSSPFFAIQFLRDNATSNVSIAWTVSGSGGTAQGTTNGFMVTGNTACFGTTVNAAGDARFFKNGVFGETANRSGAGGSVDFGSKREVILLNHNSADLGEGITGNVAYAAIWKRTLSDAEMQWIYQDPFALIMPKPSKAYYSVSAAPVASTVHQFAMLGVGS